MKEAKFLRINQEPKFTYEGMMSSLFEVVKDYADKHIGFLPAKILLSKKALDILQTGYKNICIVSNKWPSEKLTLFGIPVEEKDFGNNDIELEFVEWGGLMQFIVIKNNCASRCCLMKHKEDGTYSFVNLTKDHICPCKFRDVGEAIQELDGKRERGEIEYYVEQDYEAKAVKSYLAAIKQIKNDKNGCYVWQLKDGDPGFVRHLYEVCDDVRDLMDKFVTLTISSADFATMAEKCPWVIHFNEKDEKYFAGYRLLVDFNLPTRNYKIDDEEHSYFGGDF